MVWHYVVDRCAAPAAVLTAGLPGVFAWWLQTESTTAELELDQNLNFDFTRLQEKGKQLEPLFGPGYTGLTNLGNRWGWARERFCRLAPLSCNLERTASR